MFGDNKLPHTPEFYGNQLIREFSVMVCEISTSGEAGEVGETTAVRGNCNPAITCHRPKTGRYGDTPSHVVT